MMEAIVIDPYDPDWPVLFVDIGRGLRGTLGLTALRIDHIGSTAVPGLAAKPVIDIQVSVGALEPAGQFRMPLEVAGWTFRDDNADRTKRYFREAPGARRTHLHVRRAGSWSEQFALLFRDYLRATPERAAEYAAHKQALAAQYGADREGYTVAKGPFIWATIQLADEWAKATGWLPGPSDC
jgi:GrpB-like predicted nucleotidyltransferase (UPF0157 family)